MKSKQRTILVLMGVLLLLGLGLWIIYSYQRLIPLLKQSEIAKPSLINQDASTVKQPITSSSSPSFSISSDDQQRIMYAATLSSRFQKRGRTLVVEATGPEHRVFRFAWPPDKVDKQHLETLKKAEPLFRDLKGRGFTKVIMQIGEQEVWTHDL